MPIRIIKPKQRKYLSPDDMINQGFSTDRNPAVEFSRYLNHYLELSGDNIIINGFQPYDITYTDSSISVTISKGKLIQDLTIIETHEDIVVTKTGLDDIIYPDTGSILVYTHFSYSPDSYENRPELETILEADIDEFPDQEDYNPFGISIEYYNGTTVPEWNGIFNKIVLSKVDYEKTGGIITGASFPNESEFMIDGEIHTMRGGSSLQTDYIDGGKI